MVLEKSVSSMTKQRNCLNADSFYGDYLTDLPKNLWRCTLWHVENFLCN